MSSTDPLAYRVLNEIGIIDQLATAAFTQVLPRPLTPAQFGVLNHFVRLDHDWRTPAQLATAFQVSRPTMSNTLARLERGGLIAIEPDPEDGRGKRVSITASGRALREDCIARLAQPLSALGQAVPAEVFERLAPLLAQLRAAMDAMRD